MKDLFSLEGKTVVLTGATGYIGAYFAEALLEYGARVVMPVRNPEKAEQLEDRLLGQGHKASDMAIVSCDHYQVDGAEYLYEAMIEREGPIGVLVNNSFDFSTKTGFNDPSGKLENTTHEQFMAAFESGVYWAFQAMQIIGKHMKEHGNGSIINIGTMYADRAPMKGLYEGTTIYNPIAYGAAKSALKQMTKRMAVELAPVRVNMISPGPIPNTEKPGANAIAKDDPVLERLLKRVLMNRMGHPADLIGALIYFASDASAWTTGANLDIDGGYSAT